jgi:putative flippase GtrA
LQRLGNLVSYGMISALCAGLHLSILVLGDALGLHFALLVTVSFLVCVIVGYLLHCRFSFEIAPTFKELARYTVAMTGNYPLTLASVWLTHDRFGLPMIIAAPLSTVLLTAYNFLLSRWAVAPSLARQIDGAAKP